jgi:hypothetical protein
VAKSKDVSGATIPPGLSNEAAGAVALLGTSLIAFVLANSPFAPSYFELLHRVHLGLSLAHWVNDGLMPLFFLVIGLQLKREWLVGHLATWSRRVLPGFAALGGMILPALILWTFDYPQDEIPILMATFQDLLRNASNSCKCCAGIDSRANDPRRSPMQRGHELTQLSKYTDQIQEPMRKL